MLMFGSYRLITFIIIKTTMMIIIILYIG